MQPMQPRLPERTLSATEAGFFRSMLELLFGKAMTNIETAPFRIGWTRKFSISAFPLDVQ